MNGELKMGLYNACSVACYLGNLERGGELFLDSDDELWWLMQWIDDDVAKAAEESEMFDWWSEVEKSVKKHSKELEERHGK